MIVRFFKSLCVPEERNATYVQAPRVPEEERAVNSEFECISNIVDCSGLDKQEHEIQEEGNGSHQHGGWEVN